MAAPVVEGTTSGNKQTTGATDITIPSGVSAGETLITAIHQADAGRDCNGPTSGDQWTRFFHDTEGSTLARDTRLALFWKKADGDEGGTTRTFDSVAHTSWICYRISGAADPTVTPPEAAAKNTGSSSSPDPPSISPSGGSDDYLIIPCAGIARESVFSGAPSGYSNLQTETAGTQDSTDETAIGTAEQGFTGISSEDPGTFTHPSSQRWLATTIAVYPAAGSTGSSLPILTPPAIGA